MPESESEEPWRIVEPELDEPSPHAWVADRVWRQRRQWSRFAYGDAREEELFGPDTGGVAIPVTPELFARAPVAPIAPDARVPPEGPLEAQQARLSGTRGVGAEWSPDRWPVCCQRLSVLTLVNPTAPELALWEERHIRLTSEALDDPRYTSFWTTTLERVRAGRAPYMSFNVFQCHACGRVHARLFKYPNMASR